MLFLWFFHACRRNSPRFLMVSDHINYLTFEDPGAVNTVRRALKLAHAGDLYGAAETAGVDVAHAAVVSEGLRRGMRYSIGAEIDNDPRARPDAQNIVDAMRPDGMIRTVKFLTIDHPEKGGEYSWAFDNPEFVQFFDALGVERVWELYMARLLDDVEKLPGHIVGNFYRAASLGHWPDDAKLDQYENQLLDVVLARGMAVEIYTRPLYRDVPEEQRTRYIDANKRLMRKAKERNVPIAIGSGAHSPKDQGGAFETVLQMLDDCEINEIVFPVGGRLARVALRATKEHIEQQQKTQEPVQPGSSISGLSRAELGLPEEPERTPEEIAAAKSGRDAGPKKRASSPARTTKKPAAADAPPKSSSRRSAESAASSAKAKDEAAAAQDDAGEGQVPAPEVPAPKRAAAKSPKAADAAPKATAVKATPVKAAAAKKAPAEKPAAKPAPAKAAPAKTAPAKAAPAKPAVKTAAKAPAKKAAVAKPAAAKSAAKKAPAKSAAKPAAKSAAKSAVKKTAVKKAAPAKKAPAKKTAAKAAPKAKKPAAKSPAKKTAVKKTAAASRPVKKASKPSPKGTTTKKKSTTKRR